MIGSTWRSLRRQELEQQSSTTAELHQRDTTAELHQTYEPTEQAKQEIELVKQGLAIRCYFGHVNPLGEPFCDECGSPL